MLSETWKRILKEKTKEANIQFVSKLLDGKDSYEAWVEVFEEYNTPFGVDIS